MRRNLPHPSLFIGQTVSRFPNHVIEEHVASGSNGLLFRAFDQSTEGSLAFKFIPFENLPKDETEQQVYLNEAKKANVLEDPSVVRYVDVVPYQNDDPSINGVFFIYEFVNGRNLRDYISQNGTEIDIAFVENYLRTMFELLFELERRGFQHGDLHAGNVLVASSEYNIYNRPTFRITDFGVRELTGQITHASDYLNVAETLRQLLATVEYSQCEGRDRYIYNILRQDFLARHLFETDTSADPLACNPRGMMEKLNALDDQYRSKKETQPSTLITPFDYPNCEQIGNSHLLLKNLYSDRLLGLSEIKARSNLVLTGPRGCGKTTVFRALSLDYLYSTNNDSPEKVEYIGIYYRCDDLYFNFSRYTNPKRPEALDVPMHFLTITLLAIALEQIGTWAKRHFTVEFTEKEEELVTELWRLFDWPKPDGPSAGKLTTLVARLKGKERKRAVTKQRFVNVPSELIEGYFGPGLIFDACRLIRSKLSFLHDRHFYFFIDDYSHPKITKDLQANLNRLLMHRSPDVFFKLSTESPVSFAREDIDGKKFVESREHDLLNLGERYISTDPEQTLRFLEDLFDRRFGVVGDYPVNTLEELLGSIPRNENDTARSFRNKRGREERALESYAGIETIAAMCSGDIHYMIRLVSSMVEGYGGSDRLQDSEVAPRIPPRQQHESIRRAAGSFIESVRTLPRWGPQLADIVSAFGNVAHSYLLYNTSSNQSGDPPHQAYRIEPYETLSLSEEAQEILEELLRYSIFIEDRRGKSRRGKVVPRFYLRRYLIPHFRLTFSRRDSLQLEVSQIESLLLNPKKFDDKMRLRSTDDATRRRGKNPDQEELF